jgi:hypothetical protein
MLEINRTFRTTPDLLDTHNVSVNEEAKATSGVSRVNWIHRLMCSDSEPVFVATQCPVNQPDFTNSRQTLCNNT